VSPSDQPLEVRLTLSREEAVAFLEKLAHDEGFREEFENNPYSVLADNGIEVTPSEAMPSTVAAPDPSDLESAIEAIEPPPVEGWNMQIIWKNFPVIALLAKPMEGESEST
jgi:hypothetical protein